MISTKRSLYVNYPPKPIKILTIRLVRTCEMAQKAFLGICIFQSLLGFLYFWRKKWNKKASKDISKSYTNWKILWYIVSHVKINFFSLRGKAFEEERKGGINCKFFTTTLSSNSLKRPEHKENQTKYRNKTRKPRSHITILIQSNLHVRPPPLSDRQSKTSKFSQ